MRESLDQMAFVQAAYALSVLGTLVLCTWGWLAMRRAEKRREKIRAASRERATGERGEERAG
jgi:hypothetical protein